MRCVASQASSLLVEPSYKWSNSRSTIIPSIRTRSSSTLPMARPRLLFLASVAATLVSFVAAGGGESMGEGDCGEKQTWKLKPGEEKRCCTSFLMNDVDRFEYKATPVVSGSWGPGSISFWVEEYDHWQDLTLSLIHISEPTRRS